MQPFQVSPMLIVFLVIFLLPVKLAPAQLKLLAFSIWLTGGLIMIYLGILRLTEGAGDMDFALVVGAVTAALVIGLAKGKFILGKTSERNIHRIEEMTEPQKPMMVYSVRSWIVIGVMILLGMSLNQGWIPLPMFWRGVVNIGIGTGLVISSLKYVRTLTIA